MLKVNKFTLIVLINIVWGAAGVNILRIGIDALTESDSNLVLMLLGALLVFMLFFFLVFRRVSKKNISRIKSKQGNQHPLYALLDIKGYVVMFMMIHLGVTIRKFALLSTDVIAMFYIGLSIALIATSVKSFITLYLENRCKKEF